MMFTEERLWLSQRPTEGVTLSGICAAGGTVNGRDSGETLKKGAEGARQSKIAQSLRQKDRAQEDVGS